jgi:dienelactone hydrolase
VSSRRERRLSDMIFRAISVIAIMLFLFLPLTEVRAADMRDESIRIPVSDGLFAASLSARLFAPRGEGPFPLVVINHGKAPGNPRFQAEQAYYQVVREFVKRGYAVLVPTRRGYGSSGGAYREALCSVPSTGEMQADDIEVAINYAKKLPLVDGRRIVVIGQSVGGLATMALGERHLPGVLGLIDMSGGIRMGQCPGWERSLIEAFSRYGSKSTVPALLMYGDNDSFWGPALPKQLFDAYVAAGGKGQWIDYGVFGSDSHAMFGSHAGRDIWLPAYAGFFKSLGLPFDLRYSLRAEGPGVDVEDIDALPVQTPGMRRQYELFLENDPQRHRAFAFSSDGHAGFAHGAQAEEKALANCARHTRLGCQLYAVDQKVIYSIATRTGQQP